MTAPNVSGSDKELEGLVTEMVKAGVPDDKIKEFIRQYSPAFTSTPQDTPQNTYKVTADDYSNAAVQMGQNAADLAVGLVKAVPDIAKTAWWGLSHSDEAFNAVKEGAGNAIKGLFYDENGDARGVGGTIGAIGGLARDIALGMPIINEALGVTGVGRELGVDPMTAEERGRNTAFNLLTLGLGKYIGARMAVGKVKDVAKAAGVSSKALNEFRSFDQAAELVKNLSPEELANIARETAKGVSKLPILSKEFGAGVAGGTIGGLGMSDDPETNFRNLFAAGMTGGILNVVLGGRAAIRKDRNTLTGMEQASKSLMFDKSIEAVKQLAPEQAFKTSLDWAKGVPLVEAMQKNMPDNSAIILHEVPDKNLVKNKDVVIHTIKTGKETRYSALVTKGLSISDDWRNSFQKTGMVPSQIVAYKGKEFAYLGWRDGFILKSLEDGSQVRLKSKDEIVVPDKFETINTMGPLPEGVEVLPSDRIGFGTREDITSLVKATEKDLSPEDQQIIANNRAAIARSAEVTSESLAQKAARSGHYFKVGDGGRVELYSLLGDNEVKFFSGIKDAKEYLDRTGIKVDDTTLRYDGPGFIAPGSIMATGWSDPSPYKPKLPGWSEKLNAQATLGLRHIMQSREFFTAFETLNPEVAKGLYTEGYGGVRDSWLKFNAARHPWVTRIKTIFENFHDLTPEERAIIPKYIETMTPDEIKRGLLVNRPLTSLEVGYSEKIAELLGGERKDVGLANVFTFLRAQEAILNNQNFQGMRGQVLQKFLEGMKLTDNEMQVAKLFDEIKSKGLSDAALYPIVRLANAIMLDTPNRADFAKIHNLSAKQIAFANATENWFKEMGSEFGIAKEQLLNGYITHIRQFDPTVAAYPKPGNLTEEFFASLVRTGENANLITDPFELMLRYVNSGYRSRILNPAINEATFKFKQISDEIRGRGDTRTADSFDRYTEYYLRRVISGSDGSDALVYQTLNKVADKINPGSENRNFTFIDTLLKTIELNAQGFKLAAGLRDATSVMQAYAFRFGFGRTAKMIRLMGRSKDTLDVLRLMGEIPGLERLKDVIPEEAEVAKIRRNTAAYYKLVDNISDVAFKLSGQPMVYNYMQAATWHEVGQNAISAIRKFNEGVRNAGNEATPKLKAQLVKDLDLDSYSTPVFNDVMESVLKGNTDKAIQVLRRTSMEEVIGLYGSINSPPILGTRPGKMFFQFGQWPVWWINSWRRMLTHGTPARRIKTGLLMAGTAALFDKLSEETGFNLESWKLTNMFAFPSSSVDFRSGPVAQMARTAVDVLSYAGKNEDLATAYDDAVGGQATNRLANMLNPLYPALAPYPKPLMLFNLIESLERMNDNDPAHIVIGNLLGMPINKDEHPVPWGDNVLDY